MLQTRWTIGSSRYIGLRQDSCRTIIPSMIRWLRWLLDRYGPPPYPKSGQDRATQGRLGEELASDYLASHGMGILARNWRKGRYEIDLVCRDRDALVFVEVRTRREGSQVGGYDSLNKRKRAALKKAYLCYLRSLREKPLTYRFDVVEIHTRPEGPPVLRYLRNIPLFDKPLSQSARRH